VEKMVSNLLTGFADQGIAVDLLPVVRAQRHMPDCPPSIRVIELGTRHTALAVPAVARYLRQESPDVLLAVRDRGIRSALQARSLAGIAVPIVGNLHTNLSAALEQRGPLARWWRLRSARACYRRLRRIIAVSEGVAADTRRLAGLPDERVVAIPNPVLTQDFQQRAAEPPPAGILPASHTPLIVGSGRLTLQKDFPTLIRAFAQVRAQRPCHLLILGEGGLRPELETLVHTLGLKDAVSLPGFLDNPFPCMAAARLFVLSSRWEGSGNVITEALALGVPAVSTDCPSGPAEILGYGRFGRLVPVGDASALAEAMLATLDDPLPAQVLRDAVADYSVTRSAARYLEVLGF
jgi:glycosyltransferase involved in cell wall biosynthesis